MADKDALAHLQSGTAVWNTWRQEHPGVHPDLSEANLRRADLRRANLSGADLRRADLSEADLRKANLSEADLRKANLRKANLSEADLNQADLSEANLSRTNLNQADLIYADLRKADLRKADLSGADLIQADLSEADLSDASLTKADLNLANLSDANLRKADLSLANLSDTDLSGADLSEASVAWTVLGNVDLSVAKGLETVEHDGPSTIGIDTIYRSHGNIPETFLKGAGVDDTFITYIRSLVGKAIEYYSCFLSYSSKDDAFARRLYADLQSHNVRCWFAPEDLKWGERIRSGIDEAIRMHDKLLLILSKHSVNSGWVEHEVKASLTREKKEHRTVLFPVRVDRAVFDCPLDWSTEIRHERNIGDFTGWKQHETYQRALTRLLRDLKAEA